MIAAPRTGLYRYLRCVATVGNTKDWLGPKCGPTMILARLYYALLLLLARLWFYMLRRDVVAAAAAVAAIVLAVCVALLWGGVHNSPVDATAADIACGIVVDDIMVCNPRASIYGIQRVQLTRQSELRTALRRLLEFDRIVELDVSGMHFTEKDVECLIQVEGVHRLVMDRCVFPPRLFQMLGNVKALRELSIRETALSEGSLVSLLADSPIEVLDAGESVLVGEFSREVGSSRLEVLVLDGVHVSESLMLWLGRFPELRVLDLNNCTGLPSALPQFAALSLTSLSVLNSDCDDRTLLSIAAFPRLTSIDVSGTNITSLGISGLAKSPIVEITAYGVSIDDSVLKAIDDWRTLRLFRVDDRLVSPNVLRVIESRFKWREVLPAELSS